MITRLLLGILCLIFNTSIVAGGFTFDTCVVITAGFYKGQVGRIYTYGKLKTTKYAGYVPGEFVYLIFDNDMRSFVARENELVVSDKCK